MGDFISSASQSSVVNLPNGQNTTFLLWIAYFVIISSILLRFGDLSPYYERVIGVCVVLPAFYGLIYWLFPTLPLSIKVIFGFPMILGLLLVLAWPEKKGLKTEEGKLLRKRAGIAFFGIALNVATSTILIYSFYFPVPSFLEPNTKPLFLSSGIALPLLDIIEFVAVVLLLVSFRTYVSTIPKEVS